ncbi:MAG: hypothetical protein ACI9FB_000825 [Candidatus Azotimanducaceae bacterium]|jgi:hypothetical protein
MNVARMVETIKDLIDYYSENFGPISIVRLVL